MACKQLVLTYALESKSVHSDSRFFITILLFSSIKYSILFFAQGFISYFRLRESPLDNLEFPFTISFLMSIRYYLASLCLASPCRCSSDYLLQLSNGFHRFDHLQFHGVVHYLRLLLRVSLELDVDMVLPCFAAAVGAEHEPCKYSRK